MVTVVGLGFVGLTTALGFASQEYKVYGFDTDSRRIEEIKNAKCDLLEPFLREKINEFLNYRFYLGESLQNALKNSKYIFVCVGTPSQDNGTVNYDDMLCALKQVIEQFPNDEVHRNIIIKSTVPPGTCKDIIAPLLRENGLYKNRVSIVSNPEFLREGFCWEDFNDPGRIVIGAEDDYAFCEMRKLYEKFNVPIHEVSLASSEFSKYLSNILLATMISFSNEMSIAAKVFDDVDIKSVFSIMHDDNRLKNGGIASYIYPGCGFGGYCLPKDIMAFITALEQKNYISDLFKSVAHTNDNIIQCFCDEICCKAEKETSIGLLGLSFKPFSDDVRDTPAFKIISELRRRGYSNLLAFDPVANENYVHMYGDQDVNLQSSAEALISNAQIIMVVTAWPEFKELNYMGKIVIDGRYYLDQQELPV